MLSPPGLLTDLSLKTLHPPPPPKYTPPPAPPPPPPDTHHPLPPPPPPLFPAWQTPRQTPPLPTKFLQTTPPPLPPKPASPSSPVPQAWEYLKDAEGPQQVGQLLRIELVGVGPLQNLAGESR